MSWLSLFRFSAACLAASSASWYFSCAAFFSLRLPSRIIFCSSNTSFSAMVSDCCAAALRMRICSCALAPVAAAIRASNSASFSNAFMMRSFASSAALSLSVSAVASLNADTIALTADIRAVIAAIITPIGFASIAAFKFHCAPVCAAVAAVCAFVVVVIALP